jgi:putative transposase
MKKHSHEEIRVKLGRANELEQRGLTQAKICEALGVSVMTLHRWRKLPRRQFDANRTGDAVQSTPNDDLKRLQELQFENLQLRKIVADLMLERLQILEDAAVSSVSRGGPQKSLA